MQLIDSYYILKNTLHTFIGEEEHITISNISSDIQAENLIDALNCEINEAYDYDEQRKKSQIYIETILNK